MITFNKHTLFGILYFLIVFATMYFVVEDRQTKQLFVKPLALLVLVSFYCLLTKKIDHLYLLMLFFAWLGEVFAIFIEEYFLHSMCCYIIFHIIFIIKIYKKHLRKKSIFDILTFSFPYLMVFLILFILINDNLQKYFIPVFLTGIVVVISGAITLLNYSQKRKLSNYLMFIGLFSIISGQAAESIHIFGKKDIIFYQLLILLDLLGQYAICRGILLKDYKDKDFKFI